MITQGVRVTTPCESCGGELVRDIGQFIYGGRLWWGTEANCRTCHVAWCEEDTGGGTPEEIRRLLLAAHGSARLRLTGPGEGQVAVLRALREMRDVTIHQAKALAAELRANGLVGTLVEMEFMAARLRERAIGVTVAVEAPPARHG
ncbi:hypothetical protein ACWEQL_01305 [Kitasatospora sp. NPDC004240]